MAVTIYVLHDSDARETYIWHAASRHDPAARIKALHLLGESLGYLYRGPTGIDKMEYIGEIKRPAKENGDG